MEPDRRPSVLFATSNGTGLGHLTRAMAIARRLEEGVEARFFTLSRAAGVVRDQGFEVDRMPSHSEPGAGPLLTWDRSLADRLERLIAAWRPTVVVFDGAHPYPGLLRAIRRSGAPSAVWMRRALWKRNRNAAVLPWAARFDLVLEPGELAAADDTGPTVARRAETVRVAPIVLCDEADLLPRAEAAGQAGLDPVGVNALVALGQGAEVDAAVHRCLAWLAARPGVGVAVLSSSLSPAVEAPAGVVVLTDTYPVSQLFRGFDLVVAAAGYNSFHELVRLAVPSLFVPMPRETDDQPARARAAGALGVALAAEGPADPGLEELLDRILDPAVRAAMASRARELRLGDGAGEAAALLSRLARGGGTEGLPRPGLPGDRMRGGLTLGLARASALARYPVERARHGRTHPDGFAG
jgi:UDP:flavonoid glycosyltransferase YjiC (YdhE family)